MSRARRVPGRGAAMARQMGLLADPGTWGGPGGDGNGEAVLKAELLRGREAPERGERPRPPQRDVAAVQALAQFCLRDLPRLPAFAGRRKKIWRTRRSCWQSCRRCWRRGLGAQRMQRLHRTPAPRGHCWPSCWSGWSFTGPPSTTPGTTGTAGTMGHGCGASSAASRFSARTPSSGSVCGVVTQARAGLQSTEAKECRSGQRMDAKTLEQMLDSVRSGKPIHRADIPPAMALGKSGGTPELPPEPPAPNPSLDPPLDPSPDPNTNPNPHPNPNPNTNPCWRLQELQREALLAKRCGDNAKALSHFRAAKMLQVQLEALGRGADPDPQVEESKDPPVKDPPTNDQPTKDPPRKESVASSPEHPRDV